jgi:predicted DNA-binding transcriptional regulator AlpA
MSDTTLPAPAPLVIDAAVTTSIAESGIEIGARRYSMLGISVRTLPRWSAAGTGPPKIRIGKKVLFDLGKIPEWLASREIPTIRVTGQN